MEKNNNSYYQFGKQYFGPFLLGFSKWLDEELADEGINKVFFFARDGYMMEKACDLLFKDKYEKMYVYFSRKSIRQALLHYCDSYVDSLKYLSVEKYISLGKILEYYGFEKSERDKLAKKYNWNLFDEFEMQLLSKNSKVKSIYEEIQGEIQEKSKEQDELLLKYIHQIRMSNRCAIVDIGWKGSMQYYLEEFFRIHHVETELTGFYVGIKPLATIKGRTRGYLFSKEDNKLRKSVLCSFGLYEKLFQSLEGSTNGYKEDGCIYPVLNDYEYKNDIKVKNSICELHLGALDYLKENRISQSDNRKMAYNLIKFGKYPTNRGIELFRSFYNTDGIKEYYVSQKSLREYTFNEFKHSLSNSVWKTGFLKSLFKIPFPYYLIYKVMKK